MMTGRTIKKVIAAAGLLLGLGAGAVTADAAAADHMWRNLRVPPAMQGLYKYAVVGASCSTAYSFAQTQWHTGLMCNPYSATGKHWTYIRGDRWHPVQGCTSDGWYFPNSFFVPSTRVFKPSECRVVN